MNPVYVIPYVLFVVLVICSGAYAYLYISFYGLPYKIPHIPLIRRGDKKEK